jgi:quinol monooxygenase YgiN
MSKSILIRAEFLINEGKTNEFKKLIRKMSKGVQTDESDILQYCFYMNKDNTKCVVYEKYPDSKALIEHNNGVVSQTILPQIFNISKLNKIEVFGKPDKKLQKLLLNFNAEIYSFVTGFDY